MNNTLSYNAMMAWTAYGMQDYSSLEQNAQEIYNYFIYNPSELGKSFKRVLVFVNQIKKYKKSEPKMLLYVYLKPLNLIIQTSMMKQPQD